ncbi:hypothetical protein [Kitasatospora sp. NPDC089509]|uniref:hypothetical protein n=1 Tax=Kitasatospora sp. NPDC089509 TaxID=3364079 RepID=UPI00380E44D8
MHVIRFHLRAPERPDDPSTDRFPPTDRLAPTDRLPAAAHGPRPPSPEAVRDGLACALPARARLEHSRILVGPGAVDGIAFVLADGPLVAEAALTVACTALTGPAGPLPDWQVSHCALDTLLALGLHELPAFP